MSNQNRSIAVVVGAGGQIGGAIADILSEDYRLALIDRDSALLSKAIEAHESALAFCVDAASSGEMDRAFAAAGESGTIEVVAIAVGTTIGGSLHELDEDCWAQTVDSCMTSVFQALRVAVRLLRGRGGAICVVGSVHADRPQPGFPAYAAAKAGARALAMQAAVEYGHEGVRVNMVTPGWTRTNHTMGRLTQDDVVALAEATPLPELVEPSDVASAVAYLLSPAAHRITGAEIVVDAGSSLLGAQTVLREGYRDALGMPRRPGARLT